MTAAAAETCDSETGRGGEDTAASRVQRPNTYRISSPSGSKMSPFLSKTKMNHVFEENRSLPSRILWAVILSMTVAAAMLVVIEKSRRFAKEEIKMVVGEIDAEEIPFPEIKVKYENQIR